MTLHPAELALYLIASALFGAAAFYCALVIRENARRERERMARADARVANIVDFQDAHVRRWVERRAATRGDAA